MLTRSYFMCVSATSIQVRGERYMDHPKSLPQQPSSHMVDARQKKLYRYEHLVKLILMLFSAITVLTTIGIVGTLFVDSFHFFEEVSFFEFFTGTTWTPLLEPKHFGVLPLVAGTSLIALLACALAIPIGLGCAIYMSEYAPRNIRNILKPVLEILAGVPSIVYGYFALTAITPFLRKFIPDLEVFNALSASIALGIMIIPMVASLSEDAMNAVPDAMRKGALALGSTTFEVATKVVVPGALSGIISSFVLAISRAIGETMIVAIAAGATPKLTINPLTSVQTMTGYMVNISLGDVPHGTTMYYTIFAVGLLLFGMTFGLNVLARFVVKRYRREY